MLSTSIKVCRSAGLAGLVVFTLVKIAMQPVVVGRPATIVFAPWVGSGEAVARASVGARLLTIRNIAFDGAGFAVTVVPDRADYATSVAASGAWLVTGLAGPAGCAFSGKTLGAAQS